MAKTKALSVKTNKMAEIISERRKAGETLKRSKSFRASLRFFGSKLLHHKSNGDSITKVKSLSNLTDFKHKREFKRSISHDESYLYGSSNIYIIEPPKILPNNDIEKDKMIKVKQKKKFKVTTPPIIVAPKAAQILEIPIKENLEPLSLQCEPFWSNNNFVSDKNENSVNKNTLNFDYRRNAFHRNTLRLSLAPSKRKNFRNSLATEFPSRYSFVSYVYVNVYLSIA